MFAQSLRGACDVYGTGRLTVAGRGIGDSCAFAVGWVTVASNGTSGVFVNVVVGAEVKKAMPNPAPMAKAAITPRPIIHLIKPMISS